MSKLKPCPFCGGEAELCYGPGLGTDSCRGYTLYASCNECGAKSPGLWQEKKPEPSDPIWEDVAEEWNCRPGEIDATKCGVGYCEHHREGLPYCVECREESTLSHDKACADLADCKADRVAISQKLSDALDALFASNKQLAEANRKLAERINDDQRYLVAPLCNAEKALDDCQAELAEARADAEHWKSEWLIEQMREAISYVLIRAEPPQHDIRGCMRADCWWCQVIRVRDAALAEERGE